MEALILSPYVATVTWVGRVATAVPRMVAGEAAEALDLTFAGLVGDIHYGETRKSCSRIKDIYKIGTKIRNTRQLSVLSQEELDQIAAELDLPEIDPTWLGASLVVQGIPDFTHIPPGSRLRAASGATLVADVENLPCIIPARSIEAARPGHGKAFKAAATDRRGITAWVEAEGTITKGEQLQLFIPRQRPWAG